MLLLIAMNGNSYRKGIYAISLAFDMRVFKNYSDREFEETSVMHHILFWDRDYYQNQPHMFFLTMHMEPSSSLQLENWARLLDS